jgi:hypothetical protein
MDPFEKGMVGFLVLLAVPFTLVGLILTVTLGSIAYQAIRGDPEAEAVPVADVCCFSERGVWLFQQNAPAQVRVTREPNTCWLAPKSGDCTWPTGWKK